ncbi:dihydrofolate reductase [Rodentibacter pneumotropicus]|uniref:dihydrofolate reductase n=1 Tax=Rodentibacter pneumotropicus TaxID=758 RepID=A0A3S4TXI7_9PAST|nr:dihydrofolate reductase [Rodentibacter pneumotropicus]
MGRKTFESIGRPLPKRVNIVLSRQPYKYEGIIWKNSLESAVDFVKDSEEIMLIGGGELFKQYLPQADKLYLTQIQAEIEGDTFFPTLNWAEWHIEFEEYRERTRTILTIAVFDFSEKVKKCGQNDRTFCIWNLLSCDNFAIGIIHSNNTAWEQFTGKDLLC